MTRRMSTKAARNLSVFSDQFLSAASEQKKIDLSRMQFSEFDELALAANQLLKQRKALDERHLIFRRFAETSVQGFRLFSINAKVIYINPALSRMCHSMTTFPIP